jgi:hypothetical protein
VTGSRARRGRGRAWLGLAALGMGPGCVGLPPPPPEHAVTSDAGTMTSGAVDTQGSTSGAAEDATQGGSSLAMTEGASASEGDACIDVVCPPGEHCVEGSCFACTDPPSCEGCRGLEVCQCPQDDTCCEIGACVAQVCDPLQQDCPEGAACYPIRDGWSCAPDASGNMGVYGDPCEFINVCDPGLVCIDASSVPGCGGAAGCCSDLCDITGPRGDAQCSGAASGQVCMPWYEPAMAPSGYEDVGVCTLPL